MQANQFLLQGFLGAQKRPSVPDRSGSAGRIDANAVTKWQRLCLFTQEVTSLSEGKQ